MRSVEYSDCGPPTTPAIASSRMPDGVTTHQRACDIASRSTRQASPHWGNCSRCSKMPAYSVPMMLAMGSSLMPFR